MKEYVSLQYSIQNFFNWEEVKVHVTKAKPGSKSVKIYFYDSDITEEEFLDKYKIIDCKYHTGYIGRNSWGEIVCSMVLKKNK